jgi:hypothetical protein
MEFEVTPSVDARGESMAMHAVDAPEDGRGNTIAINWRHSYQRSTKGYSKRSGRDGGAEPAQSHSGSNLIWMAVPTGEGRLLMDHRCRQPSAAVVTASHDGGQLRPEGFQKRAAVDRCRTARFQNGRCRGTLTT